MRRPPDGICRAAEGVARAISFQMIIWFEHLAKPVYSRINPCFFQNAIHGPLNALALFLFSPFPMADCFGWVILYEEVKTSLTMSIFFSNLLIFPAYTLAF